MSKYQEKNMAVSLRQKGTSIADIAKKLMVSKSTVSYWCRDVVLSSKAREKIVLASHRKSTAGILRYTEGLRQKRIQQTEAAMEEGVRMVGRMSERDVLMVGLGLYWGEGYKKGSQEFGFTNSDPVMIKFYIRWLQTCFGISNKDLILRISINAMHRQRIKEVESYWVREVAIPFTQFTKTSIIKSTIKKVYKNNGEHFGTLRIKVRRGTRLRRVVLGAIGNFSRV
jgi:transcriptional regulator with XRE-family HTH domain